jgi:hypothetical protein
VIEIKNAVVQIPQVKINTGNRETFIGDVRAQIPDGRIDTEKTSVTFPKVRFDAAGLKNLLLGIRLQERNFNLTVQGKETSLFHVAGAYHLIPSDWNIKVHDAIQSTLQGPRQGLGR